MVARIILMMLLLPVTAATAKTGMKVEVKNPCPVARMDETVEVDMALIDKMLDNYDRERLIATDADGAQIACQRTYDGKFIFQVSVDALSSAVYYICEGAPKTFPTAVSGKRYVNRLDDFAWENDYVIFRLYGPALQATGERSFGFDSWVKNSRELELDNFYKADCHEDHGHGLDCYSVGPTLGCGAPALIHHGDIVYPWSYKTLEILDNGPLRMMARLVYGPQTVESDTAVVETRLLTIDKGTRLTRLTTRFDGLSDREKIMAGIVMHRDNLTDYVCDAAAGYNAYRDSVGRHGSIYAGCVFMPGSAVECRLLFFSEEESNRLRGGAVGHVAGISDYAPSTEFTYFFGSAWSKDGMWSMDKWTAYLQSFSQKLRQPLRIKIRKMKRFRHDAPML